MSSDKYICRRIELADQIIKLSESIKFFQNIRDRNEFVGDHTSLCKIANLYIETANSDMEQLCEELKEIMKQPQCQFGL
jgi:hypothetical protein